MVRCNVLVTLFFNNPLTQEAVIEVATKAATKADLKNNTITNLSVTMKDDGTKAEVVIDEADYTCVRGFGVDLYLDKSIAGVMIHRLGNAFNTGERIVNLTASLARMW